MNDGVGLEGDRGQHHQAAEANGIDGNTKGWKPATFDLSAYAGKTVDLRFRYATDAATHELGFFADEIKLTADGQALLDRRRRERRGRLDGDRLPARPVSR